MKLGAAARETRSSPEALPPMCILAGGLGTRLGARGGGLPKPLVQVAGRPFLLHQLEAAAQGGVTDVVLCVGYKGELIREAIGSGQFGMRIAYSYDGDAPCGTLEAIRKARTLLGDRFLVLYGDTFLRVDYRTAIRRWDASGLPAMMTVLHNRGQWGRSNCTYQDGYIECYNKDAPTDEMEWIDYGLGGLDRAALDAVQDSATDLSALYKVLSRRRLLCGISVKERFYEIGTPQALEETEAFLLSTVGRRNS